MNWLNPNYFFLIFLVVPILQWIAQRIKEQRQTAQARERIRRAQEEQLRTGRAPEAEQQQVNAQVAAKARVDAAKREAMERRQAQLRELRRKQLEAQAEARTRARQSTPQARVPQAPARAPSARSAPTPPPSARPNRPAPRPAQRPPQTATETVPMRASEFERITKQRQAEAAKRQAILHAQSVDEDARGEDAVRPMLSDFRSGRGVSVAAPDATHATTSGADLLAELTADDWRRGIVLAEVLGKPISLRETSPF